MLQKVVIDYSTTSMFYKSAWLRPSGYEIHWLSGGRRPVAVYPPDESSPRLTLSGPGGLSRFLIYPFFLINPYHSQRITEDLVGKIEVISSLLIHRMCVGLGFVWELIPS